MAVGQADYAKQQLQMFTDWANGILKKRDMAIRGLLTEDVCDGLSIINIIEIVSGQSIGRYHKKPNFPGHKLDNISVAFRFMEKNWQAKLACTPNVILEGNVQQVLGLYFILHRIVTQLPPPPEKPDGPTRSNSGFLPQPTTPRGIGGVPRTTSQPSLVVEPATVPTPRSPREPRDSISLEQNPHIRDLLRETIQEERAKSPREPPSPKKPDAEVIEIQIPTLVVPLYMTETTDTIITPRSQLPEPTNGCGHHELNHENVPVETSGETPEVPVIEKPVEKPAIVEVPIMETTKPEKPTAPPKPEKPLVPPKPRPASLPVAEIPVVLPETVEPPPIETPIEPPVEEPVAVELPEEPVVAVDATTPSKPTAPPKPDAFPVPTRPVVVETPVEKPVIVETPAEDSLVVDPAPEKPVEAFPVPTKPFKKDPAGETKSTPEKPAVPPKTKKTAPSTPEQPGSASLSPRKSPRRHTADDTPSGLSPRKTRSDGSAVASPRVKEGQPSPRHAVLLKTPFNPEDQKSSSSSSGEEQHRHHRKRSRSPSRGDKSPRSRSRDKKDRRHSKQPTPPAASSDPGSGAKPDSPPSPQPEDNPLAALSMADQIKYLLNPQAFEAERKAQQEEAEAAQAQAEAQAAETTRRSLSSKPSVGLKAHKPLPSLPPLTKGDSSKDLSSKPLPVGRKKAPSFSNPVPGAAPTSPLPSDREGRRSTHAERAKDSLPGEWSSPRTPKGTRDAPSELSSSRGLQPSPRGERDTASPRASRSDAGSGKTSKDKRGSKREGSEALVPSDKSRSSRKSIKAGETPVPVDPSKGSKDKISDSKDKNSSSSKDKTNDKSRQKRSTGEKALETMTLGRKSGRDRVKASTVAFPGAKDKSKRKSQEIPTDSPRDKPRLSKTDMVKDRSASESAGSNHSSFSKKGPGKVALPKLFTEGLYSKKETETSEKVDKLDSSRSKRALPDFSEPIVEVPVLTEEEIRAQKEKEAKEMAETLEKFKQKKNTPLLVRLQAAIRSKMSRKNPCKQIATEILTTESFYVGCLSFLTKNCQVALRALKNAEGESVVPEKDLKIIFSTSSIIYNVNVKLADQLKTRMSKWFLDGCKIGDIFLKIVGFLKTYTAYVTSYEQAISVLRQHTSNELVRTELEKLRQDPANPKNQDLPSLLIMPIQRLPRYVMLLQDLLAHTPNTHIDYNDLSKALDGVVVVAAEVNTKKKHSDNVAAVALFTSRLQPENCFPTHASRAYVNSGPVTYYDTFQVRSPPASHPATRILWRIPSPGPLVSHKHLFSIPFSFDQEKPLSIPINDFGSWKPNPSLWKPHYFILFSDQLILSLPASPEQAGQSAAGITTAFGAGSRLLKGISEMIWTNSDMMKAWTFEELREHPEVFFRFLSNVDLKGMELIDFADKEDRYQFGLSPRESKEVKYVFSFPDADAKKNWFFDIDQAIWGIIFTERTRFQSIQSGKQSKHKKHKKVLNLAGDLTINYTGTPGQWEKAYAVVAGTQLELYKNSNCYENSLTEKDKIDGLLKSVSLSQVDVMLWPPQGQNTWLSQEKEEDTTALSAAEEAAIARFNLATGSNKGLPILNMEKKSKFYFVIERIPIEGSVRTWPRQNLSPCCLASLVMPGLQANREHTELLHVLGSCAVGQTPQSWYFCLPSSEKRMTWVNRLRHAICHELVRRNKPTLLEMILLVLRSDQMDVFPCFLLRWRGSGLSSGVTSKDDKSSESSSQADKSQTEKRKEERKGFLHNVL